MREVTVTPEAPAGEEAPPPLGLGDVFRLQGVPWIRERWDRTFVLAPRPDFEFVKRPAVPAEWRGAAFDPEQQWKLADTLFGRTRYASGELGGRGGGPTLVSAPGVFDDVPIDTWPSCPPGAAVPHVPVFLLRTKEVQLGDDFDRRAGSSALLILSLRGPDANARAQGGAGNDGYLFGKHVSWPALHQDVPVWALVQDVHVRAVESDPDAVWVILLFRGQDLVNKRLATPVVRETSLPWTPFAALHDGEQLDLHHTMRDAVPEYGPHG
jgi:hypothetical protein